MNDRLQLDVQTVETSQQWKEFLRLPNQLYRNDPAYVRPLNSMARTPLDTDKHPFYQHATRQLWVCYLDGKPVGRIAAIKDDLHNEHYDDRVGFFGFLDLIDDSQVLDRLLNAASKWLQERGCTSLRGPVNPSMKGEFGVLVEGNAFAPYVMMAHTPARNDALLQSAGFDITKQFFAYRLKTKRDEASPIKDKIKFERLQGLQTKIMRRFPQLKFRAVDRDSYEETLRQVNRLGNVVRRHGWGFVPLTEPELQFMIANLRRVIRFDMIHVAYWDDQLVGFIVSIPDVNWALRKTVGRWDWLRMLQLPFWIKRCPRSRVIAIGVDEGFRKKGIANLLIKRLTDVWHEYDEWEFSWVAEDNQKSIGVIGSVIELDRYKTYRVYERPIES